MRIKLGKILTVSALLAGLLIAAPAMAEEPPPTAEAPKAAAGAQDWEFSVALYGYMASIGGEAANGENFKVDFNDILNNLDFTFMSMLGVFKGKWSLVTDLIYMDVQGDNAGTLTLPLTSRVSITENAKVDMELQSWVVSPTLGYDILEHDRFNLTLLAGARYLWIDTTLEVKAANRFRYREYKASGTQDNWDGIVGVRGQVKLNDKWYFPYYADVGTGESDLTWQVFGGIGYRFKHFNLVGGYRYMAWNFGNDDYIINDLNMSGPFVGAVFTF